MASVYKDGDLISTADSPFRFRIRLWNNLIVLTYSTVADNFSNNETIRSSSTAANNALYNDKFLSDDFKQSDYYKALATESQIRAVGGQGGYDPTTGAFNNSGTNIVNTKPTGNTIYLPGSIGLTSDTGTTTGTGSGISSVSNSTLLLSLGALVLVVVGAFLLFKKKR